MMTTSTNPIQSDPAAITAYILKLAADENKKLKGMYDAAKGDLEDVMQGNEETTALLFELQAENKRLRDNWPCIGTSRCPKLNATDNPAIGFTNLLTCDDTPRNMAIGKQALKG